MIFIPVVAKHRNALSHSCIPETDTTLKPIYVHVSKIKPYKNTGAKLSNENSYVHSTKHIIWSLELSDYQRSCANTLMWYTLSNKDWY